MADALLEVRGLTKSFGGLIATNRVDFQIVEGESHAIIGPNGAGKTTFIAQLAGDLRPDAGTIAFAGRDVTALATPARSRLRVAPPLPLNPPLRALTPPPHPPPPPPARA